MKSMPKWLLVPPVAALLVILGPMSMQGSGRGDANGDAKSIVPAPTAADVPAQPAAESATRTANRATSLPRTPDFFEIGSALCGVLLLGVGGVLVLRKLRGGASPTGGTPLVTLRQSLRLSPRQSIHALEFDDRILLIGESERGLALLDNGRQPERTADEHEVLSRQAQHIDTLVADDDGAVPKNLVIPRPANGPSHRQPTPPRSPAPTKSNTTRQPGLNDFRALLQKAGRA